MKLMDAIMDREQILLTTIEKKIIKKQLLGATMTQTERNRLTTIRKKLRAVQLLAPFSESLVLKRKYIFKKILDESIFIIKQFPGVKRILLFGSHVTGSPRLDSDIDLAVVFESITKDGAKIFMKNIIGRIPEQVDLRIYNFLPEKVKQEVDRGVILFDTSR